MREMLDAALHGVAMAFEAAGVAVIVAGALAATALFLRQGMAERRWEPAYHRYRAGLGRSILLGLELLVAADIVGTVAVTPSVQSLAVLGLIVLIRTFLSFSLEVEIEGRWPWRRDRSEDEDGREAARRGGQGLTTTPQG